MAGISFDSLRYPIVDVPGVLLENSRLYEAQMAAKDIFNNYSFPQLFIQPSLTNDRFYSFIKKFNQLESKIYNVCKNILSSGVNNFNQIIRKPLNYFFPINPINNTRQFNILPKVIEKCIGEAIFRLSCKNETSSYLAGTATRISDKVRQIFNLMYWANSNLLNPLADSVKFNYKVRTIPSSSINAYALPAGSVTVHSKIVSELHRAIQQRLIRHSDIHFPNGSQIRVDLSDVTLDDALAALLGHEMTHIASRHSMLNLGLLLISNMSMKVCNFFLCNFLKKNDEEYQALYRKRETLSVLQRLRLEEIENRYSNFDDFITWIENKGSAFLGLFKSRQAEYEADTTGIYFAKKANFNPLGTLYLQEFLKRHSNNFLHKNFEFLFTHPCAENRKLAAFAAINEIDPVNLRSHII